MAGDDRGFVGAGDGDGDGLGGGAAVAVVDRHVVLLGQRLAGGEVVGGVVGNLEAPADRAAIAGVDVALIEREGAEIAGGLRRKARRVGVGGVDIRIGDRAAGVEIAGGDVDVLGDRAIAMAGDDRGFVGAGDGDGDGLGGGAAVAVVDRHVVLLGQRLAGGEVVGGVVGNLEAPADRAAIAGVDVALIEREGAEIAGGLRRKARRVGVGGVDIRIGDRAAGVEIAGGDVDVLGDRAIAMAGDDRGFVGAGDGDGDGLGGGAAVAVVDRHVVLLGQRLAGGEVVGGVVGNLEAPADRAAIAGVDVALIEREGAEIAGGLRRKARRVGVGGVDIRIGDRAAGVEIAGGDVDVLGDRAIAMAGDDRGFVGAGDGDGDGLGGGAAVAVVDRHVVLLGQRLAGGEVVGGVVGNLEAPADRAAIAGVDVALIEREGAEIAGGLRRKARRVGVGGVDIRIGDRAAGVEIAGGDVDVLGDRAIAMAGDDRGFVGAGDGDGDGLGGGAAVAVVDRHVVLLGQRLAGGEVVGGVVGNLEAPADRAAIAGVDVALIEREGAEIAGGLRRKARRVGVGGVDIRIGDRAAGVEIAGGDVDVLGDRAIAMAGDDRGFVGAGDGDGDGLGGGAAVAVVDRHVVLLGQRLAGGEVVGGVVGNLEAPADRAAIAGVDVALIEREGAEIAGGLRRKARRVGVGGVDIRIGDRAAGVEIAGGDVDVLGDRAIAMEIGRASCRERGEGEGVGVGVGDAVAVVDRHVVLLGQRLAGGEVVGGVVGNLEAPADRAAIAGVDVALIERECEEIAGGVRCKCLDVSVGRVRSRIGDRAAGVEIAGGDVDVLGDRAIAM